MFFILLRHIHGIEITEKASWHFDKIIRALIITATFIICLCLLILDREDGQHVLTVPGRTREGKERIAVGSVIRYWNGDEWLKRENKSI